MRVTLWRTVWTGTFSTGHKVLKASMRLLKQESDEIKLMFIFVFFLFDLTVGMKMLACSNVMRKRLILRFELTYLKIIKDK